MPSLSDVQRQELLADLGGLRRFCLSLTGSGADADDLLQATVERILDKGMPEDAHTAKWAFRVCRNVWIDELRSREVRLKYPQIAGEQVEETLSAEHIAGSEQHFMAVAEALEELPEEQRLALTLVTIEGKTYAEAADILEVPVGTIMSRIARARKNLMTIYSPPEEG